MDNARAQWLSHLLSTEPADRHGAEAGLRKLYLASGLAEPKLFFWYDSPFRAAAAAALLVGASDLTWAKIIESMDRAKAWKPWLEALRKDMCNTANAPDWNGLVSAAGGSLFPGHMRLGSSAKSLEVPIAIARMSLYKNVVDSAPRLDDNDPLYKAVRAWRRVICGQGKWSHINPMLSASFYSDISFMMFAQDEAALDGRPAPPALAGLLEVAKTAGMWWPFENAVVVSDRPSELFLDGSYRPHHGDKAAFVFRDGERAWAWEGRAMRQEWIETPEKIPPSDFRHFEKSFRDYMIGRMGGVPAKPAPKPSAILKRNLDGLVEERIAILREHNKGSLPLYYRYANGDHEKVWAELTALGAGVSTDPHAADALAVAYETMRRVEANVKMVTQRLRDMGYRFVDEPQMLPGKNMRNTIDKLEKVAGTLPLSLRAFYEIVGSVDWTGSHPTLALESDIIASDPLVVFNAEDALSYVESLDEEERDLILIAPDDLHKANVSGGEPYEIAVPSLAADAKLLNERHNLNFVEYLRVAFAFGGFSGFEGVESGVPDEIVQLKSGLLDF